MEKFRIPIENKSIVEERISKLQKKAEKLGCNPISVRFGEPYKDEVRNSVTDYDSQVWIDVEVEGEAPSLSGWIFVGTLEHKDSGNILRTAPGFAIPEQYRNVVPHCDHCGHKRYRRDTYIVANIVTLEYKQVGSACLRDFLGHHDPKQVVEFYRHLREVVDSLRGDWGGRPADRRFIMTKDAVEASFEMISQFGWVPKYKQDGYTLLSTASRVFDYLFPNKYTRNEYSRISISEHSKKLASEALDWIKTMEDTSNDYFHNLKIACSEDVIEYRDLGLVCSLASAYLRHINELKKKEEKSASEWIGEIKERIVVEDITCTMTRDLENQFGTTYMHKFEDKDGNIVIWFGSKPVADTGDVVTLKGTVKDHTEFNSEKETVLTRCKLLKTTNEEYANWHDAEHQKEMN